jgi:hypothetical protein
MCDLQGGDVHGACESERTMPLLQDKLLRVPAEPDVREEGINGSMTAER